MHAAFIAPLTLALVAGGGAVAPLAPPPTVAPPARGAATPSATRLPPGLGEMLGLINAERTHAGAAPLHADATLTALAQARSQDMVDRHYFAHEIPDVPGVRLVFDLLDRAHVPYQMAGENLARNNDLAVEGLDGAIRDTNADLMHSPAHRANILEPAYTTLGLGLAVARGTAVLILTEVFVQPAAGGTRAGGTPAA